MIISRNILGRLSERDLTILDEDLLKGLYQELVDPEERHDLGEYYTPDWLATYVVNKVTDEKEYTKGRFLDPSCGSGTFLASVIRKKKETLSKEMTDVELLTHILDSVKGVDIHPLAVILSKATYIAAIGTDLLQAREGPISLPIYLADSIRSPEQYTALIEDPNAFEIKADSKRLRLPRKIVMDPDLLDASIDSMQQFAQFIVNVKPTEEMFQGFILLTEKLRKLLEDDADTEISNMLYNTAKTMRDLIVDKRDSIWAFILKNIYKPLSLRERDFDVIIGNPPWLAYRYVNSTDYQEFLKNLVIKVHTLLPSNKAELMTHMELATIFFTACSKAYLKNNGVIAFVMPRGIFVADQHNNFRSGSFKPIMQLEMLIDLEKVEPLFSIPACVVIANLADKTSYPIKGEEIEGKLFRKNTKFKEAMDRLQIIKTNFNFRKIGERSFLVNEEFDKIYKKVELGERSYYQKIYRQGATIIPRQFWFIEPIKHAILGLNPKMPNIRTSKRATDRAKKEYKDVVLEGQVEAQFLYSVVTGSELVPFGCLNLPLAVLPIESFGKNYRMITSIDAKKRGFIGLYSWLEKTESLWSKIRGEKAKKMNIYQRLNYARTLTNQNSNTKYKVLYNTSGTYLVSCVIENRLMPIDSELMRLFTNVIADHTAYTYDTNDENEAFYIASVLNSSIIDKLIKPMQSRGLYGPRHIHKKVWEFSIPKFDIQNPYCRSLVELSGKCAEKVAELLPGLATKYKSVGKIRSIIKDKLKTEIDQIDVYVEKLLLSASDTNKLEEFLT